MTEQTKLENCQSLMSEIGDRPPTEEELGRRDLTREEYNTFLRDIHADEIRTLRAAGKAQFEHETRQQESGREPPA